MGVFFFSASDSWLWYWPSDDAPRLYFPRGIIHHAPNKDERERWWKYNEILGGGFKYFLFLSLIMWGNDPISLIFFKRVETTNQNTFYLVATIGQLELLIPSNVPTAGPPTEAKQATDRKDRRIWCPTILWQVRRLHPFNLICRKDADPHCNE